MSNCIVTGGSRFLLQKKCCYVNSVSSTLNLAKIFQQYYFQEELTGNLIYISDSQQIASPKQVIDIELDGCWLSLLSTSSITWMHFLSEYIPIIESVLYTNRDLEFGILYEANLPPQSIECLKIIAGNRQLMQVKDMQNILVENLVIPTENASIYISVWPRGNFIGKGYFAYDRDSLIRSRAKIFSHFQIIPQKKNNIFIDRESKFRFIGNNEEIKSFLATHGFINILPGKLSFAEQIQIFAQASLVVAQAGSAIANVMFMPPGSKVICMCARSEWANYSYFIDYARIFDVELIYVQGPIEDETMYNINSPCSIYHPMNAQFSISLAELNDALHNFICHASN